MNRTLDGQREPETASEYRRMTCGYNGCTHYLPDSTTYPRYFHLMNYHGLSEDEAFEEIFLFQVKFKRSRA